MAFLKTIILYYIEFKRNAGGEVTEAVVHQQGTVEPHPKLNEALPEASKTFAMSPEQFDNYVGNYELNPDFILCVVKEASSSYKQRDKGL
jgi:hypothetical protein